ncbi:hypothetical protein HRbin23_00027 [bacterium HR23]|nr:hypothetical protein HRbin23_00027 [bacterium HR23]
MERRMVCHNEAANALQTKVSRRRLLLGFSSGVASAGLLILLYIGVVSWAQGLRHALTLLGQDWYFVAAIATGFGVQIGLYTYLRLGIPRAKPLHAPTAAAATGTGTSSVAMVACCAHHITDVLPLMGLSGAAIFLNQFRVPLMVAGIAVNIIGVVLMLRLVHQGRRHLPVSDRVAARPLPKEG